MAATAEDIAAATAAGEAAKAEIDKAIAALGTGGVIDDVLAAADLIQSKFVQFFLLFGVVVGKNAE